MAFKNTFALTKSVTTFDTEYRSRYDLFSSIITKAALTPATYILNGEKHASLNFASYVLALDAPQSRMYSFILLARSANIYQV